MLPTGAFSKPCSLNQRSAALCSAAWVALAFSLRPSRLVGVSDMGNGGDNGTLYKHNMIMYSPNHFINRNAPMPIAAQVLIALVCLIHVYIFLLETVLYRAVG